MISQTKIDFARSALKADIEQGNDAGSFFGHLSEANLSTGEIKQAVVELIRATAQKKELEAEVVTASVRGVEYLTGGAEFERDRAESLRSLATLFESL